MCFKQTLHVQFKWKQILFKYQVLRISAFAMPWPLVCNFWAYILRVICTKILPPVSNLIFSIFTVQTLLLQNKLACFVIFTTKLLVSKEEVITAVEFEKIMILQTLAIHYLNICFKYLYIISTNLRADT